MTDIVDLAQVAAGGRRRPRGSGACIPTPSASSPSPTRWPSTWRTGCRGSSQAIAGASDARWAACIHFRGCRRSTRDGCSVREFFRRLEIPSNDTAGPRAAYAHRPPRHPALSRTAAAVSNWSPRSSIAPTATRFATACSAASAACSRSWTAFRCCTSHPAAVTARQTHRGGNARTGAAGDGRCRRR